MASAAPKRSLFSKPSWAAKASKPAQGEDGVSIFGQNSVYADIVEEERRKRDRHLQKVKERTEKQQRSAEAAPTSNNKRRRISKDDNKRGDNPKVAQFPEIDVENAEDANSEHGLSDESGDDSGNDGELQEAKATGRARARDSGDQIFKAGTPSSEPNRTRKSSRHGRGEPLGGSNGDDFVIDSNVGSSPHRTSPKKCPPRKYKKPDLIPESESEDEDESIRELKRKAREEARAQGAKVESVETLSEPRSPGIGQSSNSPKSPTVFDGGDPIVSPSKSIDFHDPAVQIYIKTIIPHANPLIVTRRASQPLDTVIKYWCEKNELAPMIASKVFFTWNGNRLYNSTTMRGILDRLKKVHPQKDAEGRIEIEAMTDEILQHRQEQAQKRRDEAAGIRDAKDNNNSQAAAKAAAGAAVEEEKLLISLQCDLNDVEEVRLRVRPSTTMHKILYSFRKSTDLAELHPDLQESWLVFDGERLEPHQTVQEVGFEEDDVVEVYFKR